MWNNSQSQRVKLSKGSVGNIREREREQSGAHLQRGKIFAVIKNSVEERIGRLPKAQCNFLLDIWIAVAGFFGFVSTIFIVL